MFNIKLTPEQRLQKAVGRLLHEDRYKPLAGIMMLGKRTIDDNVPTACTNGRDEKYGRDFVNSLSDSELRFVIIHECYHKMYRHLITWKHLCNKNMRLANAAMDYVINLRISDENTDGLCTIPMRDGKVFGLIDEKYRGMDTAQVFKLLEQEQDENDDDNDGHGDDSDDSGDSSSDGSGDSDSSTLPDNFDDHDWEGAQDMDEEEKRHLEQEIDNAIRQGAMAAGKMGISGDRLLGDLLEVQVDWREVLRDFITTTCAGKDYSTWRRPNRRFISAGVYMPSAISERVDELCIAVDTSGSIGNVELNAFLTEVKGVCDVVKPERIRLLYWGSEVVGDETYDAQNRDDLVKSTKPKEGGGTDVECVVRYINKHNINPQAVICLTDGHLYGGWGTWSVPILWTILDNKHAHPPCGKTVHISSDSL